MRLNWFCELSSLESPASRYTHAVVPALGRRAQVVLWTWGALPGSAPDGFADARLVESEVPWSEVNRADVTLYVVGGEGAAATNLVALSRLHAGVVVVPPGMDERELARDGGGDGGGEGLRRRALGVVVHDRGARERAGFTLVTSLAVAPDPTPPRARTERWSPEAAGLYAECLIRFALGSRQRRASLAGDALAERSGDALAGWRLDGAGEVNLHPLARQILGLVSPSSTSP